MTPQPFILLYVLFAALVSSSDLLSAPRRYVEDSEAVIATREMRDTIDLMRHEVNNHEAEIRVFEERAVNQDAIIESLREQIAEINRAFKEIIKEKTANLENKITTVETTIKSLIADLSQVKTHANELTKALTQNKQKNSDLEKIIELQNQNMDSMQAALGALMEALQVKENSQAKAMNNQTASNSGKTYVIRPGDSLEKIARAHQTTVKVLKDLNGINDDRIIVGQKILIR